MSVILDVPNTLLDDHVTKDNEEPNPEFSKDIYGDNLFGSPQTGNDAGPSNTKLVQQLDNPFGDSMFDEDGGEPSIGGTSPHRQSSSHLAGVATGASVDSPLNPFGDSMFDNDTFGSTVAREIDETIGQDCRSPLEELANTIRSPRQSRDIVMPSTQFESLLPDLADWLPSSSSSHSTRPSHLSSISARSYSGKLVLLTRRVKVAEQAPVRVAPPNMHNLLSAPLHRLLDNISASSAVPTDPSTEHASNPPVQGYTPADMWVDKYRPKRFTDLVGDESVHRATLAWLKEWDQCVFKKRPPKAKKQRMEQQEQDFRPPDEWGRPHEKILLLSGPPGLGKTTLAHVVASQAGYSVLEINASDARTGNVIDERIKPALETGKALGKKRPVLVIVDEVDGATGENSASFVAKLVQLTIDGKRKRKAGEKRNGKDKQPLLRPIICICNDLWAPSIVKLRAIARIVRFHPAAPTQLVKRLREVCDNECLQADTRALGLLVAVSQGDFRGCLNTLQMIHTRKQHVTEPMVRQTTVGMKEAETTAQAVWNDIFSPMSKKRTKDLGLTDDEQGRYVQRLTKMLEACGTMDKIMLGCFTHYATLHHQDPSWARYTKANRWFSAYDLFASTMRLEQDYAVQGYLPYFIAPIHPLFVDPSNSKVSNPKADWEWHIKTKATEDLARTLTTNSTHLRHLLQKDIIPTELAPLLNRLISPPIRPVNKEVIKPEERAMVKKVVHVMVELGMRFVQERTEDGAVMYRVEPQVPVDVFVTYEGKRPSDIPPSKFAVRHMLAAEIEAEYAARHSEAVEQHSQGRKTGSSFGRKRARQSAPGDEEEERDVLHPMGDDDALVQLPREPVKGAVEKKEKQVDIADK
ncbi:hypothetical protein FRB99_000483 [Tulasnella sp. 403]|nr:hypothetical protein FRB99_000483 [Tulasnella sp. 403]